MAGKFKGIIKRELKLYGVSSPVVVTITGNGVEMAVAGARKKAYSSWDSIARQLSTPMDVPSYLADKPIELLKHQAAERKKKEERKLQNSSD